MKIVDVVVLKSLKPITISEKKSDETLEFLHRLFNQTKFIEEIYQLREQHSIPKHGLDIKPLIGNDIYKIGNAYINAMKVLAEEFSIKTGLSEEYALQIALLIFYNAVVDVTKFKSSIEPEIEFIFGRSNISNKMWEYNHEVGALIFPFHASKNKIIAWLNNNWDTVVNESANNFTNRKFIQATHKNILKEEEIRLLKSQGKSISEIVKIFNKKYPEEKWYPSKIKKIHADEKQRISLQKHLNNNKMN